MFALICVFFLQIATLASEDQLELYQRLSFERGRCYFPVDAGGASAPQGLGGTRDLNRD